MKLYGLIGYPLGHSFSASYFAAKFARERIRDVEYRNFELGSLEALPALIRQNPALSGFNVTIPYKSAIIPFLDGIHGEAAKIEAVNTVVVTRNKQTWRLDGYNTDIAGFRNSLLPLLGSYRGSALILGKGGSAKAVACVLGQLEIPYFMVTRNPRNVNDMSYPELREKGIRQHRLIINTTPLGMYPDTGSCPEIPYHQLTSTHILFDLVYNPAETEFLKRGKNAGSSVKNGQEMLELQAEEAWKIWMQANAGNKQIF